VLHFISSQSHSFNSAIQLQAYTYCILSPMVAAVTCPHCLGSLVIHHKSPLTLYNIVHDHMYVKSDWDHFDGLPAADEEDTYLLIEELARELFDSVGSDYEHPKWTVVIRQGHFCVIQ
jgi:hypothetical protein